MYGCQLPTALQALVQLWALLRVAPSLLDISTTPCAIPAERLQYHMPRQLGTLSRVASTFGAPFLPVLLPGGEAEAVPGQAHSPHLQSCALMLAIMTLLGVAAPLVAYYLYERGERGRRGCWRGGAATAEGGVGCCEWAAGGRRRRVSPATDAFLPPSRPSALSQATSSPI